LGARLEDVQIVFDAQVRQVDSLGLGTNQIELDAAPGKDAEGFGEDRVCPIENHADSHRGSFPKRPVSFDLTTPERSLYRLIFQLDTRPPRRPERSHPVRENIAER